MERGTESGLEPRPLDPEASVPSRRPPRLIPKVTPSEVFLDMASSSSKNNVMFLWRMKMGEKPIRVPVGMRKMDYFSIPLGFPKVTVIYLFAISNSTDNDIKLSTLSTFKKMVKD